MKRELWIGVLVAVLVSGSVLAYVFIFLRSPSQSDRGPSPTFAMHLDPNATQAIQGDQVNVTVTIVSQNNFDSQVFLDLSDYPAISGVWDPQVLIPPRNGSLSSTLRLVIDVTVFPGNYTLTIRGRSEELLRTANLTLYIRELPPNPTFALSVSPAGLIIARGESDFANVTVTSLYGFDQDVTVNVTSAVGVTSTFPNSSNTTIVRPPVNGSLVVRLTVEVSATATPGKYTLTVAATNSSLTITRSLQLTVSPPPVTFTMYVWMGGWNSSIPDPTNGCSPSGTPTCNPNLNVLVGQRVVVNVVGADSAAHNMAYYLGGYTGTVSPFNPDALNRSSVVFLNSTTFVYAFPSEGIYDYYCEYHVLTSRGKVLVTQSPAPASMTAPASEEESAVVTSQVRDPIFSSHLAIASAPPDVALSCLLRSPLARAHFLTGASAAGDDCNLYLPSTDLY